MGSIVSKEFCATIYQLKPQKIFAGPNPSHKLDLQQREHLQCLFSLSITVIVNLLHEHDYASGLRDYTPMLKEMCLEAERKIEIIRSPIPDFSVPDTQQMLEVQSKIEQLLGADDNNIYLHCRAGLGRTGTVAATLLKRRSGVNNDNVFDQLNALRQESSLHMYGSPETEEQRAFVRNFFDDR